MKRIQVDGMKEVTRVTFVSGLILNKNKSKHEAFDGYWCTKTTKHLAPRQQNCQQSSLILDVSLN